MFPFVRFGVFPFVRGKNSINHRLLWKTKAEAAERPQELQPLSQELDCPTRSRTSLTGQPCGPTRSLFHETQL